MLIKNLQTIIKSVKMIKTFKQKKAKQEMSKDD